MALPSELRAELADLPAQSLDTQDLGTLDAVMDTRGKAVGIRSDGGRLDQGCMQAPAMDSEVRFHCGHPVPLVPVRKA